MLKIVLHSALRQLHGQFTSPVTLAGLGALSLILGLSGPFGTMTTLALPWRLLYWALIVPVTFAAGYLGPALAGPALEGRPVWLRLPLISFASSIFVFGVLMVVNWPLGFHFPGRDSFWSEFAVLFGICLAIEGASTVLAHHGLPGATEVPAPGPATPRLVERLPEDLRGDIVSLSVQDHYVAVTTTKGSHELLIRLADAVAETAPVPGLQVHRSHWVALDQVAQARRAGDTAVLTMSNGAEVPVSRANVKAVQAAGLLPGGAGAA